MMHNDAKGFIWRLMFTVAIAATMILPGRVEFAFAQGKSAKDIFLDKCTVCHGEDGAGKTAKGKKLKVKDVRETSAKLTAEQMVEVVTKGKGDDMAAFGKDFTADQIKQIVEYYRGLAKK